jgi:hypothetical protein
LIDSILIAVWSEHYGNNAENKMATLSEKSRFCVGNWLWFYRVGDPGIFGVVDRVWEST